MWHEDRSRQLPDSATLGTPKHVAYDSVLTKSPTAMPGAQPTYTPFVIAQEMVNMRKSFVCADLSESELRMAVKISECVRECLNKCNSDLECTMVHRSRIKQFPILLLRGALCIGTEVSLS